MHPEPHPQRRLHCPGIYTPFYKRRQGPRENTLHLPSFFFVDGDVSTLFASHVCRSRLHVSSSQFHSKMHSACQTTSGNIAARFFGISASSKKIMTHFVRTRIVRWTIPSLLLLSHFSARNSVCVPGRQCFTRPSFCFDMIMQKHPVVFADVTLHSIRGYGSRSCRGRAGSAPPYRVKAELLPSRLS